MKKILDWLLYVLGLKTIRHSMAAWILAMSVHYGALKDGGLSVVFFIFSLLWIWAEGVTADFKDLDFNITKDLNRKLMSSLGKRELALAQTQTELIETLHKLKRLEKDHGRLSK